MSFAELFIVLIVGLVIVGPDRLPQAIKSGLIWLSRIKRILHDTRSEFENQLGMDEIRREIHNEQVMASLKALEEAKKKLQETGEEIGESLTDREKASSTEDDGQANTIMPPPAKRIVEENFEEDQHLYGEQLGSHPERRAAEDAIHQEAENKKPKPQSASKDKANKNANATPTNIKQ